MLGYARVGMWVWFDGLIRSPSAWRDPHFLGLVGQLGDIDDRGFSPLRSSGFGSRDAPCTTQLGSQPFLHYAAGRESEGGRPFLLLEILRGLVAPAPVIRRAGDVMRGPLARASGHRGFWIPVNGQAWGVGPAPGTGSSPAGRLGRWPQSRRIAWFTVHGVGPRPGASRCIDRTAAPPRGGKSVRPTPSFVLGWLSRGGQDRSID